MRRIILLVHLFIAAFVAPAFILVAVSGGLYLIGIKGEVDKTAIALPAQTALDFKSTTLKDDVAALVNQFAPEYDYEYLKVQNTTVVTRPTSRQYLEFKQTANGLSLTRIKPDLQKRMIELHKGHGPGVFKTYQKFVAVGLLLVVLSGLWAGLNSAAWRSKTITMSILGTITFFLLASA